MSFVAYLQELHPLVTVVALLCASLLSIEFIRVVHVRRSRHPWVSYCVSAMMFAIAAGRLSILLTGYMPATTGELLAEFFCNLAVILAALMIPLVKERTYRRVRTNDLQTTNSNLEYTKHLFTEYMNNVPAFASIRDDKLELQYVNNYWSETFGLPLDKFLGLSSFPGNVPIEKAEETSIRLSKHALDVLKSGKRKTATERVVLKGIPSTFIIVRFPLLSPQNHKWVGGLAIDVTERQNRKQRIKVFSALIQQSPDAVYAYDDDGRIQLWNTGAERMLGLTSDDMFGQHISRIFPPEKKEDVSTIANRLKSESTVDTFESEHLSADGSRKRVAISATRLPNQSGTGYFYGCMARDITYKHAMENQIARLNADLEESLSELSVTNTNLESARDQALTSVAMKSAFVANISHELRTPLGGILGLSELILKQEQDEDTKRIVGLIHDSAQALLEVVNDVLSLSALEAGKASVEVETFNPIEVVGSCVDLLQPTATSKGIGLTESWGANVPPLVSGDASKVRQVLLNLISNAIKFTKRGAVVVKVDARILPNSVTEVTFSIIDTGIGIQLDEQHRLFTPFSRIGQPGMGGAGLGLVLSKQFVELMGGEIGFQSVPGAGSTFWFKVPFQPPPLSEVEVELIPSIAEPSAQQLAEWKILSVEDSPVLSLLTERQLRAIGVRSDKAASAEEAIAKTRSEKFDCILMDVNLPDMSGYEATQAIRNDELAQHRARTPIIALTASVLPGEREKALDSGMDDYLCKPISIARLKTALIQALYE